jgi:sugar lactone lactonase YvrE
MRRQRAFVLILVLAILIGANHLRADGADRWNVSAIPELASVTLHGPYGIARGPDNALYICDCDAQLLLKLGAEGKTSTVAGNGTRGYSGDGGPATAAQLSDPYEVRFDHHGDIYFVEMKNNVVRKVDHITGVISTVAGTGKPGFSGDAGPANKAQLNQPHSIQFDSKGDLYICDIANSRIRKVDMTTGIITTFAGTGKKALTPDGALRAGTPLNGPRAIDFDRAGNLYLALREGNAVYKLDTMTDMWHRIAGTGAKGFTGNGGPALRATLSGPKGLSIGPDGNAYLADTESHCIRRIDVKKGTIDVVAGNGTSGNTAGIGSQAQFKRPHGIFVDADGSIFVGDTENDRVCVIRTTP